MDGENYDVDQDEASAMGMTAPRVSRETELTALIDSIVESIVKQDPVVPKGKNMLKWPVRNSVELR